MKIGVYFSPWNKVAYPTGVGRHAVEMVSSLAARDDVDLSLLASQNDAEAAAEVVAQRAGGADVSRLPGSDRVSRLLFIGTRCLSIDRWVGDLDWIYCSKEQPVATRNLRLAVNVHDVLAFEPEICGLNNKPSRRSRWRWAHVMKHIRRADLITTVSEFTKQRLVEYYGCEADQVVVAGNGVSDVYFREPQPADEEILAKYGVQPCEYFYSSGSLTRRKGGDLLLEAHRALCKAGHDIPILLSGRRHDADLLRRCAPTGDPGDKTSLRLLGFIPDEDQAVLLTHALALLFPSRYEGFGIPVLEALAAGAVAVCSRIPALVEVAGDAAIFVEPNTVDQLVDVMVGLVDGDVTRAAYLSRGRLRAAEYRWERCANRLVDAMSHC